MTRQSCILTQRDRYVLERLRGGGPPLTQEWQALLRQKLAHAQMPAPGPLPADLATLDARVTFRCASGLGDTRTLCLPGVYVPGGAFLPVTTFYGLALLGLREGQSMAITRPEGRRDWIVLDKVLFQPQTVPCLPPAPARPSLRLVAGGFTGGPPVPANENGSGGEPGPPAA